MKKFFFSCLAIAAIAACAKTEDVYTADNSEIKIAPVTSHATKTVYGSIDGTQYPANEEFVVNAYWDGIKGEKNVEYLQNVVFARKDGTNYWAGQDAVYYWPKNGTLRFACYSPETVPGVTHDVTDDSYNVQYTQPSNTAKTTDFMLAPITVPYTAQTATENVSVVFEHALSWITLKVKAANPEAAEAFVIHDMVINDVKTTATLNATMGDGIQYKEWGENESDRTNPADYAVVFGQNIEPAVEAVIVENNPNGTVVIPQVPTTLTIYFTQKKMAGTPVLKNQEITIPLTLDENQPWEPGKHYIYTVVFDLDEILINPSVADWEDVVVNDAPATEVVATTEAELITAINNGGQVRLGADIVTTENFHVYESINIDLNGYTLTAKVGDEIFARVYEGATFTIGRGTVVCDDYMVSVNAGGVAVINDGVYTAETTVVNVNGGKAYITGGYFEDNSTYNGQYLLNHVDSQKYNGLIEITGGSFVNFNPAAASSENPAMNFVKTGYNVTCVGNVYTVTAADADVTFSANTELEATYNVVGAVLDGAGNTVSVEAGNKNFVTSNTFRFINATATNTEPVTIKNLVIDGNDASCGEYGIRAIFLAGEGVYNIENVEIYNVTYTINDDAAAKTLNVTDSVLEGWTSYNKNTVATFTNVEFKKGTYYTFRPYGATILTNCAFEDGFVINLDKLEGTIVFDNCTYNGAPLAEANLTNEPAGLVTIQ